jgi:hypothetical protein
MEIVSYVLEARWRTRTAWATATRSVPGDVQRMSAGTGVMHSEFNHAPTRRRTSCRSGSCRRAGIAPGYEQKHFDAGEKRGRLRLVASRDGRDGSRRVHATRRCTPACSTADESASCARSGAQGYVLCRARQGQVNGQHLGRRRGALSGEPAVVLDPGRRRGHRVRPRALMSPASRMTLAAARYSARPWTAVPGDRGAALARLGGAVCFFGGWSAMPRSRTARRTQPSILATTNRIRRMDAADTYRECASSTAS